MSEEAKVLNRGACLYSEAPYYFTMFDRKGTPFVYLLFADGSTPFTYPETGLPWIPPLCLLHLAPHQPLRHLLPSSSLAMSLSLINWNCQTIFKNRPQIIIKQLKFNNSLLHVASCLSQDLLLTQQKICPFLVLKFLAGVAQVPYLVNWDHYYLTECLNY